MTYNLNFSETEENSGIFEGNIVLEENPEDLPGVTLIEDSETGNSFYLINEVTTGQLAIALILILFFIFEVFKLVISRRIPHLTRYWK